MTSVRCPMRECRRSIDLGTLPPMPERPEPAPCLHFIAAWGAGRGSMAVEVLYALDGNRELTIRNLRPAEVSTVRLEEHRDDIEAIVRRFARVVEEDASGTLFGDPHERDAVSRELAQLILGPDPMVTRTAAR